MTEQECLDKYGNIEVKFSSYYKYSFSFIGKTNDGLKISCSFGGDSDDIYRFSVDANAIYKVSELEPIYLAVYDENDNLVERYMEEY